MSKGTKNVPYKEPIEVNAFSTLLARKTVNIPIELLQYAQSHKLQTPLQILIASKLITPGFFCRDSIYFQEICKSVNLQPRSVQKHLNQLLKLGWMGFDKKTGYFYVRSFAFFYKTDLIRRKKSVSTTLGDIQNFKEFIASGIINSNVADHISYYKWKHKNKKLFNIRLQNQDRSQILRPVVNKKSTTSQGLSNPEEAYFRIPEYFGLSNHKIAELLHCSYTNACNLKHKAEKAGYLTTNSKFRLIKELDQPDFHIRNLSNKYDEELGRKMRFIVEENGEESKILMVEQLHDEIIPKMRFITRKRIKTKSRDNYGLRASDFYGLNSKN